MNAGIVVLVDDGLTLAHQDQPIDESDVGDLVTVTDQAEAVVASEGMGYSCSHPLTT